jgi:hypothetical protein
METSKNVKSKGLRAKDLEIALPSSEKYLCCVLMQEQKNGIFVRTHGDQVPYYTLSRLQNSNLKSLSWPSFASLPYKFI